jgi:hypothetical protein
MSDMMKKSVALSIVLVVLVSAVLVAERSATVQVMLGNWGFVKSVQRDNSVFYRLKVKLIYKGESQNFDIVVACSVLQANYMDGGRTVEVGLTPSVFGRRMSDGKGLVVRPPRACGGETTENGAIPPDLMPVVVVYEDAETLAFGTAYLTDDAYDNSLSTLQFGGATIEQADQAAFEKFRTEQPNLVKRSSYHTPNGPAWLKQIGVPPAPIPMGIRCYGYARFRLGETDRERAREYWPAERPHYWVPTKEQLDAIDSSRRGQPMLTDRDGAVPVPRGLIFAQLDGGLPNWGLPRRNPVPRGKSGTKPALPSYYPDIGGWVALPWPSDPINRAESLANDGPRVGASIDFRNGVTRGFAYCLSDPRSIPTGAPYSDPALPEFRAYFKLPPVDLVDGINVANASIGRPFAIIERDEFIYHIFSIGLGSTRGDV